MAIQTSYPFDSVIGIAGACDDGGLDQFHKSAIAQENMKPGKAAVLAGTELGKDLLVRLPQLNELVLEWDADFAGDTVAGGITLTDLDGNAGSEQTINVAAATLNSVAAALDALTGLSAEVTDATNRQITVISGDSRLAVSTGFSATGGAAPTTTETLGSADEIYGIIKYDPSVEADSDGTVQFKKNDPVGIVRKARVFVQGETALTKGGNVLARHTAGSGENRERGTILVGASSADAVSFAGARVSRTTSTADDIGALEFNLP